MRVNNMSRENYLDLVYEVKKLKKIKAFDKFDKKYFLIEVDKKHFMTVYFSNTLTDKFPSILFIDNLKDLSFVSGYINEEYKDLVLPNNFIDVYIVPKSKLSNLETGFLIGNEILSAPYVIAQTYKQGFMPYISTDSDAKKVIKALSYINALVKERLDDVISYFGQSDVIKLDINKKKNSCNFEYIKYPFFNYDPIKREPNFIFLENVNNAQKTNDTAYFLLSYVSLPVKVKGCNVPIKPTMLSYAVDYNDIFKPQIYNILNKDLYDYVYDMLEVCFKEHGIPDKLIVNDRDIYSFLYETLEKLGVELIYKESNEVYDVINFMLSNFFDSIFKIEEDNIYIDSNSLDLEDAIEFVTEIMAPKIAKEVIEAANNELGLYDDNDKETFVS